MNGGPPSGVEIAKDGGGLTPEWRDYFLRLLDEPRRPSARAFLRRDIAAAMRRLVRPEASVLEAGVGAGHLLAALPNAVRVGIDSLPEAAARARQVDGAMRIQVADALTYATSDRFDAILCDRLCHSVPDVQRLLENLRSLLAPGGRIYLTHFNFLWSAPLGVAAALGLTEPAPAAQNWLSASDFDNLFELTGLEPIRCEDRLLLPADLPPASRLLNRFAAKLPLARTFTLYRIYTLRKREAPRPPPKVTVVVPARNEAGNIAAAIARTPVMGAGTELVFVEGGSTDDTYETIARAVREYRGPLELKLLRQGGRGKADAVRVGFSNATGDLLMILDADLTVPPEDLPKFYEAMVSGLTDYVHGTRLVYPMEDEAMRFLNKLGNAFFAKTFSYLLDQPIKDTLCGTKVTWKTDYEAIVRGREYFGDFDPFGDFDLIFGASRLGLKIVEIPVRYKSRTYGETNISRFRHGLLLLKMSAIAARKLKFI